MFGRDGIDENLRFLILEVRRQVLSTRDHVREAPPGAIERIFARDDYVDNLRNIIQRKCFAVAAESPGGEATTIEQLKAINVITTNLERIADFCESIIGQLAHLQDSAVLRRRDFDPFFDEVVGGIDAIDGAVTQRDVQVALGICRREDQLDRLYAALFADILDEMTEGHDAQSLVTTLFISHYLERMGDSLLNIGEAIISAALGQRIKIDQFRFLRDSLRAADHGHKTIDDFGIEAVAETRSGCRIDRVIERDPESEDRPVIFKEGRAAKLIKEREAIEAWQALMPGLPPRVYSFHQRDDYAAILFEYLRGRTFEDHLLHSPEPIFERAFRRLCETVGRVWDLTRRDEPVHGDFVGQLQGRLADVFTVHPDYADRGGVIGSLHVEGFTSLVQRAQAFERRLSAPFSVRIHGDFNVDNVIYDRRRDRLHYIDLNRSRMMDYAQDVSVFLVSNYRLRVFEAQVRRRINRVILDFHDFACAFARHNGDTTFEARLLLGLARSFATSTRFVLDERLAKSMFLRARYLLERFIERAAAAPDDAVSALRDFEIRREALID